MTARDYPASSQPEDMSKPAANLVRFLEASPTPYHAVRSAAQRLEAAGFQRLSERGAWNLKANGRYFTTRNQSSIIAFALPKSYQRGEPAAIAIVGAHTDSCNFKLRPISKRKPPGGNYMAIGVETYGGGLWHSWLNRDLGIAGRVIVASTDSASKEKTYTPHLIHLNKPLVHIPAVAIHLDRTQNEKTFYNQETGMQAILGLVSEQTNAPSSPSDKAAEKTTSALDISSHHHPRLLELISQELSASGTVQGEVRVEDIHDFDLSLVDSQPATLGGANEEFVFSARLDNLFSTFCGVEGLCQSLEGVSADADIPDGAVRMYCSWDNEEIGSVSAYGAESNFMEAVIARIVNNPAKLDQALAHSFLLSSDMGHAAHPAPDHWGKHQAEHRPLMNGGPAIKTNAKIRYASTAATTFLLRRVAEKAGVPLQEFEVKNDMPCGSTIGPLCSKIGLRTVDIGCVQLSMHSIRETAGAEDVGHLIQLFKQYYQDFQEVDKSLLMDD